MGIDVEFEIMNMNLEELYNLFIMDYRKGSEEYGLARYGINLKFDIHDYFDDAYCVRYLDGTVSVRKTTIGSLDDFRTELEDRIRYMRELLLKIHGGLPFARKSGEIEDVDE